jgi:ArsR family transcriptional regulator
MDMPLIEDRSAAIDDAVLERAARIIKVLGHPLRLRILESLERGELNVAELQEATGASQALVSQQLGILRAHGVVEPRRDGPRVFYRVIEPKVARILDCIRECDLSSATQFTTCESSPAGAARRGR